MKSAQLIVLFAIVPFCLFAQKPLIKFGNISQEEIDLQYFEQDSAAVAVVLADYGRAFINVNIGKLVFERHTRVKILKKEGLDHASGSILLYQSGSSGETVPRLAVANGKRIFLTPNLMNRSRFIPEENLARKSDIIVKTGWTDYDTIRYHLPEYVYHEFLPEPIHIESVFGIYDAEYTMEAGLLVYKRRLTVNEGKFSADNYQALCQFYQNIRKADELKVVFLNET